MDCDVSPLSLVSPWSPPPAINLSLTTWSPEWDVLGEGQPLTGCSYLLWGSQSWHGYPFADLLSSLKGLFKHQDIIILLRILFTTYLLLHCANFIFSQFAPIAITAWGRVMWTAISELLCCYWSGPGRETIGDHPTSPHQLVTDQGWEELKRVRKRNKSNINACPALNSSFLNILMGGFSTIQTDLSQNNLQINYQHHPFDKIFKMPSCWKTVLRKPATVLPVLLFPFI